jgi:peptide/nickel transport system permease protein
MLVFFIKRILLGLLVAICVSMVTFSLLQTTIDPAIAIAGEDASSEKIQALRVAFGYDQPLYIQYGKWLINALQGDLGTSPYFGLEVRSLISDRLPVTIKLGALAICFAIGLGVPLGVLASIHPNSWIDRLALTIAVIGQAIPSFWLSLLLIIILAVQLEILPVSGSSSSTSYIMPMIVLGTNAIPSIMRLTRTGMLDTLSADFIRTAWAKGLRPNQVFFKHALRNALIPVVAMSAIQAAHMLGGSIIVESVFALHGLGMLAYESILRSDIPTMQAVILIFSSFFILFTTFADILNAYLDPRIRVA